MSSSSAPPPAVAAEGPSPVLDAARIVEVLARHRVDYLLIGGVAGRYPGAERLTNDFDFSPDGTATTSSWSVSGTNAADSRS
jgi:hypothetical protein